MMMRKTFSIAVVLVASCGRFGAGETSSSSSSGSSGTPEDRDGGGTDAQTAGEGGLPATSDGGALTKETFCAAPMPSACATPIERVHFDPPSTFPTKWPPSGNGQVAIQDESFCAPRGARAAVEFPTQTNVQLTYTFSTFSKLRLRYAVRGPVHVKPFKLRFGCQLVLTATGGPQRTDIRFDIEQNGEVQLDGETKAVDGTEIEPESVTITPIPPNDTWKIVELAVDRTGENLFVTGRYDGIPFTNTYRAPLLPDLNELRCGLSDIEVDPVVTKTIVSFLDDIQFQVCP